ncbi:hypothetical protein [Sphingomonas jeddahensis]|uniref:Uncharacterized protein n=1 Tax=Sphingomonas jeddahensis TaxID=1915074 RepID=A0A1V2ERV3_9SPHN|nr:hypothetical protein [Sphingomonas jeddahensis]ONF95392.1 hypothetical protein SPHI_24840 [Sphingomonas jeddahensis]
MKRPPQSLGQIFAAPLLIATASVVGLVCALTGEGWRDAVSWAGLAAPVTATVWAIKTRLS